MDDVLDVLQELDLPDDLGELPADEYEAELDGDDSALAPPKGGE